MDADITTILSPLKSGACEVCAHHYLFGGEDTCAENHIGISTRTCQQIKECKHFRRNYTAGAPEMKE